MEITFETPAKVWRGRGRPAREPSERALRSCRESARVGRVAVLRLTSQISADDIRELKADLRAAERKLGGRVHIQQDAESVRWWWEKPSGGEA